VVVFIQWHRQPTVMRGSDLRLREEPDWNTIFVFHCKFLIHLTGYSIYYVTSSVCFDVQLVT